MSESTDAYTVISLSMYRFPSHFSISALMQRGHSLDDLVLDLPARCGDESPGDPAMFTASLTSSGSGGGFSMVLVYIRNCCVES